MPTERRFLLLQGPVGPFFQQLADCLAAAGQQVHRVRFNGGDRVYSGRSGHSDFRGSAQDWPSYLDALVSRERSTDVVLFGDCRPLHRAAIERLAPRRLGVHVFEEGYLRPGWITLERGGVNGYSSLPRDPAACEALASRAPDPVELPPPSMSFARRAAEDVLHTLATAVLAPRYPGYRSHKPWSPMAEYRAGARRFFGRARERREGDAVARELVARQQRYFLFPLQLDSDAQIRVHSPFGAMAPAIEAVIASFAAHAPPDTLLLVSEHPLDQGVVDLGRVVQACAAAAGISSRLRFLRGGTPPVLVAGCAGVVTVNSTVGLSALAAGRPLAALGSAVYRIAGLCHQGPLDRFWSAPEPPCDALFAAFRRVLVARSQLRGGYYGPQARRLALEGALPRLLQPGWTTPLTSARRETATTPG